MVKHQFIVLSRHNRDADGIREALAYYPRAEIDVVYTGTEALAALNNRPVTLFFLNFHVMEPRDVKILRDMRQLVPEMPLVTLSRAIQKDVWGLLKAIPRTVLVEKPFVTKDLLGICHKMIHGRRVAQRLHRRFYTDEEAQIFRLLDGEAKEARLLNLSQGGAYLEFDSGSEPATFCRPGDMVKVQVPLQKLGTNHQVTGRVVWLSDRGEVRGSPAVGIEFIAQDDIYRHLLEKL